MYSNLTLGWSCKGGGQDERKNGLSEALTCKPANYMGFMSVIIYHFLSKIGNSTYQKHCRIVLYIRKDYDKTGPITKHMYSILNQILCLYVSAALTSRIQHPLRIRLIQKTSYLWYGFKEKNSRFSSPFTLPSNTWGHIVTTMQLMLENQIFPGYVIS